MKLDEKLVDVLRNHKDDIIINNWVPVVAEAYLQGGAKFVNELKEVINSAGIDKKFFNDAIEKIITDLLRVAIS